MIWKHRPGTDPRAFNTFAGRRGSRNPRSKKYIEILRRNARPDSSRKTRSAGFTHNFSPKEVTKKITIFLTAHKLLFYRDLMLNFFFCAVVANVSQYAHYVFQSLDHERNGILNFEVSTAIIRYKIRIFSPPKFRTMLNSS